MVCVSPLVQSILERSVMYGDFKMDGDMAAPVEQSFHSPRADLLTTPNGKMCMRHEIWSSFS